MKPSQAIRDKYKDVVEDWNYPFTRNKFEFNEWFIDENLPDGIEIIYRTTDTYDGKAYRQDDTKGGE